MHISANSFLVYFFLLCLLMRDSLSVPADAFRHVRDLTARPLSLHPFAFSLDLIPTINHTSINHTSHFRDLEFRYRVPNSYVNHESLFFYNHQTSSRSACSGSKFAFIPFDILAWRQILSEEASTDTETTISNVVMYYDLGFHVDDRLAISDTIDAARK